MLMMAVSATGSLMFFVLPRFTKIYEAKGAALPKLTQVLVSFSQFLGNITAMAVSVTLVIIISVAVYFWKQTTNGQKVLTGRKYTLPYSEQCS